MPLIATRPGRAARPGPLRRGSRRRLALVLTLALGPLALPGLALAQDAGGRNGTDGSTLESENARLRAENERLRSEIEALRGGTGPVPDDDAAERGDDAAERGDATPPEPREAASTTVEPAYAPVSRVSLTVVRDDAGSIRLLATPWYRTVEADGLLPVREFVQLRAAPAAAGRAPQVWLSLRRNGVRGTLSATDAGHLRIGSWVGEAPIVEHDVSRRHRRRHAGAIPPARDEYAVFALPTGSLDRLAAAREATFEAGPVDFRFTDSHVAAASALAGRLAREENP